MGSLIFSSSGGLKSVSLISVLIRLENLLLFSSKMASSASSSSSSSSAAAAAAAPISLPPAELNFKKLRALRWDDEAYDRIQQYLKDGSFPADKQTDAQKAAIRKKAKQFELNAKGQIVLVVKEVPPWARSDDKQLYQINLPFEMRVVKESERVAVCKMFYGDVQTNGYRGSDAFYNRIAQEFLGISRADVEATLKTFEVHQMGMAKNSEKVILPIKSEFPMQRWQMDLIDVSQHHRLNGGIVFILNVVDHFSKFAWSRPLKNKSVQNVAFELQQIILQEGPPDILQSDNGGEFTGDKMQELTKRFVIDHRLSLPYKPRTNGLVERFNQTLKNAINKFLTDHDAKVYITHLQQLVFSYNTTFHNTIKATPFEVHRKRHVKISLLNTLVQENIAKAADKMIADSNKRTQAEEEPLFVGDEVRIDMLAIKKVRKMAGFERKAKHIHNWSKKIYTVSEAKEEDDVEQFRLDPTPDGESERRWYMRHQLFKVDRESMEQAKSVTDKVDLNFGAGPFDLERHLVEMPRRDRRIAMMSEAQMEREEEKAASAAAAGPRRTARAGAGRNDAYYANNALVGEDFEI